MKKTLVIYASTAPGHEIFARNLADAISGEIDLADFFDIEKNESVSFAKNIVHWVREYMPGVWSFISSLNVFSGLVKVAEKPLSKHLDQYIAERKYQAVMCVQPDMATLVGYLKSKGWYQGDVIFATQDLFIDSSWNIIGVDYYAVPLSEQREELMRLGVPPEKILVVGLTIPRVENLVSSEVRNEKQVLVIDPTYEILSELQHVDAKLLVVYDGDEEFKASVQKDFGYNQMVTLVPTMNDSLYAFVDLVVTSPVPVIVAKALDRRKPVIISDAINSADTQNYSVLRDKALVFPDFVDLRGEVVDELTTGTFQKDLLDNQNVSLFVQHGEKLKELLNRS